jgi:nucleotide-binding universal stress UspA family protein
MFHHILLPTDGSEPASRALSLGAELAARLGARVTVMTALEHFPAGIMGSAFRPAQEAELAPGLQAAMDRLDQAVALVRQAGLDCQRLLLRDRPVYQAILDAAQAQEVDLIVMGTHGLGLVDRLFVGSQTQRVLARTRIPVLTLH